MNIEDISVTSEQVTRGKHNHKNNRSRTMIASVRDQFIKGRPTEHLFKFPKPNYNQAVRSVVLPSSITRVSNNKESEPLTVGGNRVLRAVNVLELISAIRTSRESGAVVKKRGSVLGEGESRRGAAIHGRAVGLGEAQGAVFVDVDRLAAGHDGVEGEGVVAAREAGYVAGIR